MGRVMGFEPTNIGTTIRGLNHLATPAIYNNLLLSNFLCGSVSEPNISHGREPLLATPAIYNIFTSSLNIQ